MSPDDRKCLGPPRCRYTSDEGIKQHEPGCPMLLPPPVVRPDPMRYRNPVAVVTGGALDGDHASGADRQEYEMLYGIPAAIGVEIPLTHRVGDYLAQPRNGETALGIGDIVDEPRTPADLGLPAVIHDTPLRLLLDEYVLIQPEEQRLIDDIKKGETAGELRKAIDRFMASVYDAQIDSLAAKRREHTKRLIK